MHSPIQHANKRVTLSTEFADQVLNWFDTHGRKDLPWQHNPTPYRVWVSEIMLQQTQVATVIPYYTRFMQSFPDVKALADADQDEVLKHWAGLGYYSRARNLHAAAKQIRDEFAGKLPDDLEQLISLKGIGRSTAGAILSLAFRQAQPILDGNVKRVLTRYHAIEGWTGKSDILKRLWQLAEAHLPTQRNDNYTQAIMDLGATLCTRSKPTCLLCPLQTGCRANQHGNPTDYPTPKPRKQLPEKHRIMLLIQSDEGILLQKQPSPGIWGGLWSLPQFEDETSAEAWMQKYYGQPPNLSNRLDTFSHTFSHFRLHVQPILLKQPVNAKGIMEAFDILWYNKATEFTGGLPAPIEKLFKRIL